MADPTTRQKLIDAGIQAVLAGSYHGVGLSKILADAGVPKGSFYHYFQSKEDFGVSLIEHSGQRQAEMIQEVLTDRRKKPSERLQAFLEIVRDCVEENDYQAPCLVGKLAQELGNLSDPMREAIRFALNQRCSILAKCIAEGQKDGEISSQEPAEILADFVNDSLEGARVRMSIERNSKPMDQMIELVVGSLLRG